MLLKINGKLLVDKSGNPKSFKKQAIEDLEVMFPDSTIEIIHEGGSSKLSIEKAVRLGITDKAEQDKFLVLGAKFDQLKEEMQALLKRNKCNYIVEGIKTNVLVGHDWYIQNIDKPDAKLIERVLKARKEGKELSEATE